MTQLREQVLQYLPPSLRDFFEGGSRREILKQIDTTLLLFDDSLVHVESGRSTSISGDRHRVDAKEIARAARELLADTQKEKDRAILLLLPPSEFIATSRDMPGVTRESIVSALNLQSETLLPACDLSLAMAVNPASADIGSEHVALWIPRQRLIELFDACAGQGLFLAAVKPRVINVPEHNGGQQLVDFDENDATAVVFKDGIIKRWLQVNAIDFEQDEFSEQWQQQVFEESRAEIGMETDEFRDTGAYLERMQKDCHPEYSFIPDGALNARKKVEKGRKLLLAAAALAGLMFLASIPFIVQSLEFRRAAATLAANREMSVDARNDQSIVVNFENEWGPISDFPQQNVREAMFTLQNVLSPDQLTSMEISEGLIRIQGTSDDPQAILQRLEQDPLFTEVVFSRATNNTRYYIDLRLSPVNFEAYMVRYFPDD